MGQNAEFIIVKQHPTAINHNENKKITNYFIIPLKEKISEIPDKNLLGPLTFEQFERKKKELNIGTIDFTIVFNDLK